MPMPRPLYYDDQRLPACYMNFYIANGVVIVPTFDDPADAVALETLGRLFPGRQIRGIDAIDLVWGLGAFHCITQQQPAVTARSDAYGLLLQIEQRQPPAELVAVVGLDHQRLLEADRRQQQVAPGRGCPGGRPGP